MSKQDIRNKGTGFQKTILIRGHDGKDGPDVHHRKSTLSEGTRELRVYITRYKSTETFDNLK